MQAYCPPSARSLILLSSFLLCAAGSAQEWKNIFNGKDLSGWKGDPKLWRVEQGTLVGETDQDAKKVPANTFLIWQGGEPGDFELEYQARVTGENNSGVQYRSRTIDPAKFSVGGYQMDLHPDAKYLGMLYEEQGRGIACESGQSVELGAGPKVVGEFERPPVKLSDWNSYRIVASGDTLKHFVNGKQVAEIKDVDDSKRSLKGVIALQLHAGPAMKAEFKDLRIRPVAGKPVAAVRAKAAAPKVAEPTAKWIWQNGNPGAGQKSFFRREFQLPRDIVTASVTVTCDNWQRTWVNGKDLGWTSEWAAPASHDVTKLIRPGAANVIAVEGRNEDSVGGMALRFSATLKDGKKIFLVTDDKWVTSLEGKRGWQEDRFNARDWTPAVAVAKMGDPPWGAVIAPEGSANGAPEDVTADFQVVKDFRVERLYKVPNVQGSWVAMTVDGNGKLLCADQYGKIYRVTPPVGPDDETVVTPTAIPLSGAHGLLWHQGVLYVTVNEGNDQSGVWKVTDTDRDGEPDKPELIKAVSGRGEHGPHALVPSPDGEWIYFVAGNFTDFPEMSTLMPKVWAEDQLLPRRPDAKGHAHDRMAPGGWVARFKPDGSKWELFASGFRNTYDIAFNTQGDLFGYDSDMEWDLGMPWYRPTRVCHIVPGAEFGWRHGTGPWPAYYEDSMPPQVDLGPGSPTGLLSGRGAKFPEKYQRAIYAFDWTYATIHAIHLTPEGSGYKAEREEFVAGTGMPLTDAAIGKDGAMYFLTGGRRTASALWRVTYAGQETTTPVPQQKKELTLASKAGAWEGMGSTDRIKRFESRVAVEAAGPAAIASQLARETNPWQVIGGSMALARTGDKGQKDTIVKALCGLDWAALDTPQKLNWLRACGLAFARQGEPSSSEREAVLAKIDSAFPSSQADLDRELCRMLSYLQAPGIVGRTLALMDTTGPSPAPDWLATAKRNAQYGGAIEKMIANLPPAQVIHYIYCLRVVKGPWSEDERKRFFAWFDKLLQKSGGESYAGFIVDLRKQTLENCTPQEREWIGKMAPAATSNPLADLPPVKGPGREWSVSDVERLAASGLEGRDKENGKKMFQASLCAACHRFDGAGGSAGPDLTAVAGRFSVRDLAEAIIDPSKVVSDQYAFDTIIKKDGSQVVGKLIEEKDEHWIIATSPFDFSATMEVERSQIKDIKPSPISPMPAGMINRLNADELKDLLAYLLGK